MQQVKGVSHSIDIYNVLKHVSFPLQTSFNVLVMVLLRIVSVFIHLPHFTVNEYSITKKITFPL